MLRSAWTLLRDIAQKGKTYVHGVPMPAVT